MGLKDVKLVTKEYVVDNIAMATTTYIMGKNLNVEETVKLLETMRTIISIVTDFMFTDNINDDELKNTVIKIKNELKGEYNDDNN